MEKGALFRWHPAVSFGYLVAVVTVTMLVMHPAVVMASLIGGLAVLNRQKGPSGTLKALAGAGALSLLLAALNLFYNRRGSTPLWEWFGYTVTWEAALYGVMVGLAFSAALLWWMTLSRVMTSDRLQTLLGRRLPSLCLLMRMILRFLPRYRRLLTQISQAQSTLSGEKGGLRARWRRSADALACATSLAAEDALITADSMTARGYGGRATCAVRHRWQAGSVAAACAGALLLGGVIAGLALGACPTDYFPTPSLWGANETWMIPCWAAFCLLPTLDDGKEALRWLILFSRA